ncbi:MAG: protein phosphatase 2C domain-containing protein [Nocardioides sp.]
MQISFTSVAAPGTVNEDLVIAGPSWVAVFDGATAHPSARSGCIHDVPWLVRQLAAGLAPPLLRSDDVPLADALAQAIETTCAAHANTCDLANPDSPSSTVAIARISAEHIDYLVLADSPIMARYGAGYDTTTLIQDTRSAHLPSYAPEAIREARNNPEGFWVASTKPEAAEAAVTGTLDGNPALYLLTDGITRYVELLHLGKWEHLAQAIDHDGADRIIDTIREAERRALPELSLQPNGRRLKRHDDATIALVTAAIGGVAVQLRAPAGT